MAGFMEQHCFKLTDLCTLLLGGILLHGPLKIDGFIELPVSNEY